MAMSLEEMDLDLEEEWGRIREDMLAGNEAKAEGEGGGGGEGKEGKKGVLLLLLLLLGVEESKGYFGLEEGGCESCGKNG